MMYWILLFSFFTITCLFTAVFQMIFLNEKRLEKRMKKYLAVSEKEVHRKQLNMLGQIQLAKKKVKTHFLTKEKNTKLGIALARSGLPLKPEEYVLFQWILTIFTGGLLVALSGNWFFFLIGGILGFLFPKWYVKKKERVRISKFNEELPDMISTIIGSLRAGFSFPQALKTVIEEAAPPIKDEMEFVLKEMQYGRSLEDSLTDLKERMPSEDLDLMIQAILIQRQVGGNLAAVLDKIVETIRDRTKIQRQIQTLTAQGRLSGIVIGLLPIILGFVIYLIQPSYIGTLFHHPIGIMLLIAGAFSGIIGFIMIKKMTTIEV
ncbi:MAG TPA: type II secretion system F family protein [Bacillales bacterium]|nr:type II secretion system F family protein [Bacillales bacterium]